MFLSDLVFRKMQIIYSKTVGKHHFSEKTFHLSPNECVLIVLEREQVVKRMESRVNHSTRACDNKKVIVLVKSRYVNGTLTIPKNTNVALFLMDFAVIYEIKSVSLKDFVTCGFLTDEHLIYAFFKS